ncbi:MAG: hypothetical protein ABI867_42375 [Kofleriaceae bacterium]
MTKYIVLAAVVVAGCGSKKKEEGLEPPPPAVAAPAPTPPAGSGSGSAAPVTKAPAAILTGFSTPESVLYDAETDVYFVSNINGKPADVDDNGFISRITAENKTVELKWIDGSKPDVKLDAPKGMAISGGILWVADITVVRKFDVKTGKPMGEVKIDGATFLNDVAVAPDGIYVTDMGVNAKFEPTGTDAIYSISKTNAVTAIAKAKELGGPNGVLGSGSEVWVVTFRDGVMYNAKDLTKKFKLPKGTLDGLVSIGDGDFLVSSWEGKTVFKGHGETWTDLHLDVESPADIGWDSKRKKLLVPNFNKDEVRLYDL